MMPMNCGRVRRRNLLHPLWVLLDVISANEGDGFVRDSPIHLFQGSKATDVPEQINIRNV